MWAVRRPCAWRGLMVRDPALTPEKARRQLGDDVRRRLVLRGMTETGDQAGPPATIAGLRTAVEAVSALNVSQLDGPTRRALALELAEAGKIIARLEKVLK